MLVKHNNVIMEIERESDENNIEFNKRTLFILKNLESNHSLQDIVDMSYIYSYKETLGCVYEKKIENLMRELTNNIFIKI